MDKIIIKDLLLRGILGLNPEERIQKQNILVNVVMYHDISQAAATDDVTHSLNYATISERITDRVETGSDLTVEKLVTDLARMIVVEYGAARVMVRVEKPTALPFAASVGVEIERTSADFGT